MNSHAGAFWGGAATLLLFLTGCSSLPPEPPGRAESSPFGPAPDLEQLEAPGVPTDWSELERLAAGAGGREQELRRAALYLRVDRPGKARTLLDQICLDPRGPAPIQAAAHYLNARACLELDLDRSCRHHLAEARRLAASPALARRLERFGMLLPVAAPPAGSGTGSGPAIHSRREWGARPVRQDRVVPMGRIHRITVHHTAIERSLEGPVAVARHLRNIQGDHMGSQAWGDIGYHYLIDGEGRVWQGREIRFQGAHAGNHQLNRGNLGICLLGNFQHAPPPARQLAALKGLLEKLAARHHVPGERIYGHCELKATACPGRFLMAALRRIRRKI